MTSLLYLNKKDSSRAFTLIELLIVVAIIAILAAIAVPNFLEAQVRSKVSRVKADMRTLSTAIESYAVDYNRYPIDSEEGFLGITPALWTSNRGPDGPINMWNQLTTPVAYITTRLQDPFIPEGSSSVTDQDNSYNSYHFARVGFWKDRNASGFWANAYGYKYIMRSMGPARVMPRAANGTIIVPLGILSGMVNYSGSGNPQPKTEGIYDATNGTRSEGWLVRTNKGIYTAPQS